jgi:hypothetical protein
MAKGARTTKARRGSRVAEDGRVWTGFSIQAETLDRLDAQADKRVVSPSLIAQRALDEYLTKLEATEVLP